jgi:hypothetical protein
MQCCRFGELAKREAQAITVDYDELINSWKASRAGVRPCSSYQSAAWCGARG